MFLSLKGCSWARDNFNWVNIHGFLQMLMTRNGVLLMPLKRAQGMKMDLKRYLSWFGITSQTTKMISLKISTTIVATLVPPTSIYPLSFCNQVKNIASCFVFWQFVFLVGQKWWRKWWNSGVATNKVQEEEAQSSKQRGARDQSGSGQWLWRLPS